MLAANATVVGFVGTRIHAMQRIERDEYPGIAIQLNGTKFHNTKSGASETDVYNITVGIYDDARDDGFYDLCEAVKVALNMVTGTYDSIVVKGCEIKDASFDDFELARPIWLCLQDYEIMVKA